MGLEFDFIVVCSVTGSLKLAWLSGSQYGEGIRLSALMARQRRALQSQMREIVDQTADLVELQREIEEKELVLNPDYAYPAYGIERRD